LQPIRAKEEFAEALKEKIDAPLLEKAISMDEKKKPSSTAR
jgi:hypothetical protein